MIPNGKCLMSVRTANATNCGVSGEADLMHMTRSLTKGGGGLHREEYMYVIIIGHHLLIRNVDVLGYLAGSWRYIEGYELQNCDILAWEIVLKHIKRYV
jgi:hypothetical protein